MIPPYETGSAVFGIIVDGIQPALAVKRGASNAAIVIEGIATKYFEPHVDGDHYEAFAAGAFASTLAGEHCVRLLIDHRESDLVATSDQGLELYSDEKELRFKCTLPNLPMAQRALAAIEGGRDQMSVGFRCLRDEWRDCDGKRLRIIWEADLQEISIVKKGAVPGTSCKILSAESVDGDWGMPDDHAALSLLHSLRELRKSLSW